MIRRQRECLGIINCGEVTPLLRAWSEGKPGADDALLPLIYAEVQALMREIGAPRRHVDEVDEWLDEARGILRQ